MIIYVEGNIGSGKTTFINNLDRFLEQFNSLNKDARIVLEPVDDWIKTLDSDGQNILEKFYGDQYKCQDNVVDGPGKVELVYTPDNGDAPTV